MGGVNIIFLQDPFRTMNLNFEYLKIKNSEIIDQLTS